MTEQDDISNYFITKQYFNNKNIEIERASVLVSAVLGFLDTEESENIFGGDN